MWESRSCRPKLPKARGREDRHVMRDCRLRELHPEFDIRSAEADTLANGTGATLLQGLQDTSTSRIGDGVEDTIQFLFGSVHGIREFRL